LNNHENNIVSATYSTTIIPIMPKTNPIIVTGMRLYLGNSFISKHKQRTPASKDGQKNTPTGRPRNKAAVGSSTVQMLPLIICGSQRNSGITRNSAPKANAQK
jgi:hypothetical protein